jgi:hypothetical protein
MKWILDAIARARSQAELDAIEGWQLHEDTVNAWQARHDTLVNGQREAAEPPWNIPRHEDAPLPR